MIKVYFATNGTIYIRMPKGEMPDSETAAQIIKMLSLK